VARGLLYHPDVKAIILLAVASACTEVPHEPEIEATSTIALHAWPQWGPNQADILFVVEKSPAMAAHRDAIADAVDSFVAQIQARARPMDFHIGIVTSDLGTRGLDGYAPVVAGCTADGDDGVMRIVGDAPGRFLVESTRHDGARLANYRGSLAEVLRASLDAGTEGCRFSRPLEAMRRALEHPDNAGFLRTQGLAVVFLTARDDCSFRDGALAAAGDPFACIEQADQLVPTAEYAAFLDALPTRTLVSGAFGPAEPFVVDVQNRRVEPSCVRGARSAEPGVRLHQIADALPRATTATIALCEDELGPSLDVDPFDRIPLALHCLTAIPRDTDLLAPGLQPDCQAWSRIELAGGTLDELLPLCDGSQDRCWEIAPANCLGSGLGPKIHGVVAGSDARETTVIAECVIER
jgi:hypothetical protein